MRSLNRRRAKDTKRVRRGGEGREEGRRGALPSEVESKPTDAP